MPEYGKVPYWERQGYTLIATDMSAIIQVPAGTQLEPSPLKLKSGDLIQVGDKLYEMYGPRTAAGWKRLRVDEPLIYQGTFECPDGYGRMACFVQGSKVESLRKIYPNLDTYFAWAWHEKEQCFMFCTRYMAARVIETNFCKLEKGSP